MQPVHQELMLVEQTALHAKQAFSHEIQLELQQVMLNHVIRRVMDEHIVLTFVSDAQQVKRWLQWEDESIVALITLCWILQQLLLHVNHALSDV